MTIADPRLRITLGEDFVLFDPRATALLGALGQIEVQSSKPIPFLIEKLLYLMPGHDAKEDHAWGFRSVDDYGRSLAPFTRDALLRLLHAVFA